MLRSILSAFFFGACAIGADQAHAQYYHCDHVPVIVYPQTAHFHSVPSHFGTHSHAFYPSPIIVPYGTDPRMGAMNCNGDQCGRIPLAAPQYNPSNGWANPSQQQNGPESQYTQGAANQLNQVPTVIPNPNSEANNSINVPVPPVPSNGQQGALPNFTSPQQNVPQLQSPAMTPEQNSSTSSAAGSGLAKILQDDSPLMSGGEQLGSIDRGQELKILNIQGNWVQLETTWLKANAWIRKDLVDLGNANMTANTDVAPLAN